jgi:hypothetical protein
VKSKQRKPAHTGAEKKGRKRKSKIYLLFMLAYSPAEWKTERQGPKETKKSAIRVEGTGRPES